MIQWKTSSLLTLWTTSLEILIQWDKPQAISWGCSNITRISFFICRFRTMQWSPQLTVDGLYPHVHKGNFPLEMFYEWSDNLEIFLSIFSRFSDNFLHTREPATFQFVHCSNVVGIIIIIKYLKFKTGIKWIIKNRHVIVVNCLNAKDFDITINYYQLF